MAMVRNIFPSLLIMSRVVITSRRYGLITPKCKKNSGLRTFHQVPLVCGTKLKHL